MSEFHVGCGSYCDRDDPCMCCRLGTEVDRLTDALTERDRRIEAALERLQWAACTVRGCKIPACSGAHDASALLRGESDE